jgi:hypothetical protein
LSSFEQSLVALGISAATAFSLPKSVGAMFGLTYASAQPLALDDYVERLEISKGSASQGLKFLQHMGAIKPVYFRDEGRGTRDDDKGSTLVPGRLSVRRTYYEPETSLRRILIGILNENILPHLKQSGDAVDRLREQLGDVEDTEERAVLADRLKTLEGWGKKGRMLLPLAERVLSGPLK